MIFITSGPGYLYRSSYLVNYIIHKAVYSHFSCTFHIYVLSLSFTSAKKALRADGYRDSHNPM